MPRNLLRTFLAQSFPDNAGVLMPTSHALFVIATLKKSYLPRGTIGPVLLSREAPGLCLQPVYLKMAFPEKDVLQD